MRFTGKDTRVMQREFEMLLGPHLPALYRTASRFTGQTQDAEDLVQNLLLKLYPRLDELRRVELLRPWLLKVLYREFVDSTRRARRLRQWLQPLDGLENDDAYRAALESDRQSPETLVDRFKDRERIRQALNVLNNDQRAMIALHDMEGYTMEEIAVMLDMRRGTVKSRLHRARARLRLCLDMEPFALAERVTGKEANES